MLAVADTGPPHYLILCGAVGLLPRLFDRVVLPDVVRDELQHPRTPEAVRRWIADAPRWVEIVATPPLQSVPRRGAGEHAAIAVALNCRADVLLIDDREGVAAAEATGLRVTGTLGLLDRAARRGLIDLADVVLRLQATNFHCRPDLFEAMLARHQQERHS